LHSTSPSVIFKVRMLLLNLHCLAILWFCLSVLVSAFRKIKEIKRNIKVLFTSGYTGDVVLDKGLHEEGFNFISKPLSPNVLLQKVKDVLDK